MKKHQDPTIYKMFRRCFDCQADFEMRLRIKGLWDEYQKTSDHKCYQVYHPVLLEVPEVRFE